MTDEEWRPYRTGAYECSSLGRIRRAATNEVMRGTRQRGYVMMSVTEGGVRRREFAHRMVAEAFLGSPPVGRETVNHKDGIKDNNAIENLEYLSAADNIRHAHATGLGACGTRVGNAVLDDETVAKIRREHLTVGTSLSELARRVGVPLPTVQGAVRGGTWKHVSVAPVPRLSAAQRLCRRGHAFTPENSYVHGDGTRECRACKTARDRLRPLPELPPAAAQKEG